MKTIDDLPGAQQKALFEILKLRRPVFKTSELVALLAAGEDGRSIGGVLGSLYRNGYLQKIQGGRDKTWKLSDEAAKERQELKQHLNKIKEYWS